MPSTYRKQINQIIVIRGGTSVRGLLQLSKASKHFWASKLVMRDNFEGVANAIRSSHIYPTSAPSLHILYDDSPEYFTNLWVSNLETQSGLTGHTTRDCQKVSVHHRSNTQLYRCQIPSTFSQIVFLLARPSERQRHHQALAFNLELRHVENPKSSTSTGDCCRGLRIGWRPSDRTADGRIALSRRADVGLPRYSL